MDTYHVEQVGDRFIVCNQRRETMGGAVDNREFAQSLADSMGSCLAAARQSREDTRRELGHYYDPTA